MRPKSAIYNPKRDDEHPRHFHMGVPPRAFITGLLTNEKRTMKTSSRATPPPSLPCRFLASCKPNISWLLSKHFLETCWADQGTGSRGVTFVRKNYPSYMLPCKIHNLVILINKFAQCNLCESSLNGFLLVPYAVFLDLDLCARFCPPYSNLLF